MTQELRDWLESYTVEIPLCPKCGLVLRADDEPAAQRFAGTFPGVWHRIPQSWRDEITQYWWAARRSQLGEPLVHLVPFIVFDEREVPPPELGRCYSMAGWTDPCHPTIWFVASAVLDMPDPELDALIAHELAHTARKSDPDWKMAACRPGPAWYDHEEGMVHEILLGWGFDDAKGKHWIEEHLSDSVCCYRERRAVLEREQSDPAPGHSTTLDTCNGGW